MKKLLVFVLLLTALARAQFIFGPNGQMFQGLPAQVSGGYSPTNGQFAFDSFTDADATELGLHVGEFGAAWVRSSDYSGSAVVENNRIRSNSGSQVVYRTGTPSRNPFYTCEADFLYQSGTGGAYLCQRLGMKGEDGQRAGYNTSSGKWEIQFNNSGGGWAVGGGGSYEFAQSLSAGVTYHIRFDTYDISSGTFYGVRVYIDGVLRIDTLISIAGTNIKGACGVSFDGNATSFTGIHVLYLSCTSADASPTFSKTVAFALCGESICADYGREREATIADLLCASTRWNTERVWNFSVAGRTIDTQNTQGTAEPDSRYSFTAGYGTRLAIIRDGLNDIVGSASAATTYSRLQTWCSARHAEGYKTLVGTIIKSKVAVDNGVDTVRTDFNALLIADHSFSDYYVDFAADSAFSDTTNATYYQADQSHLTLAGATKEADLIYATAP